MQHAISILACIPWKHWMRIAWRYWWKHCLWNRLSKKRCCNLIEYFNIAPSDIEFLKTHKNPHVSVAQFCNIIDWPSTHLPFFNSLPSKSVGSLEIYGWAEAENETMHVIASDCDIPTVRNIFLRTINKQFSNCGVEWCDKIPHGTIGWIFCITSSPQTCCQMIVINDYDWCVVISLSSKLK